MHSWCKVGTGTVLVLPGILVRKHEKQEVMKHRRLPYLNLFRGMLADLLRAHVVYPFLQALVAGHQLVLTLSTPAH